MKKMMIAAVLAVAPTAYANDETSIIDDSEFVDQEIAANSDASPELLPPRERRGIGVSCVAEGRFAFGRGHGVARDYYRACNQAAREAFSQCSGQFFAGPFPACTPGGGWRDRDDDRFDDDDFDNRRPDRRPWADRWRSCFNMRCRVARR